MAKPLVSILIPCFNAERWLAECLESVLAQSWDNKEIIVVNDGSTDASAEILRKYEKRGIKVLDQENSGASVARNRALRIAQGELVEFIDADDLLASDKIAVQVRRLATEEPKRVAAGAWVRFHDRPDNLEFRPDPVWADLDPVDWLVLSWEGGGNMPLGAWLTPRSVIEKAGPWDETPCPNDDGEFFTRVLLNSSGVAFCNEARFFYRSGIDGSLSGRRTPEMLTATFRSIELSTKHLLDTEDSPRTRAACATHFQRFIYDVYPFMPHLVREAEERIQCLGGSSLKLEGGGRVFRLLLRGLGWKPAKRVQVYYRAVKKFNAGLHYQKQRN